MLKHIKKILNSFFFHKGTIHFSNFWDILSGDITICSYNILLRFMKLFLLWKWLFYERILFKNIFSILERLKLCDLYLYSLHKTLKFFMFNEESQRHQTEWSNLRKHKWLKKMYSGGILTMCTRWPIASSHIAS